MMSLAGVSVRLSSAAAGCCCGLAAVHAKAVPATSPRIKVCFIGPPGLQVYAWGRETPHARSPEDPVHSGEQEFTAGAAAPCIFGGYPQELNLCPFRFVLDVGCNLASHTGTHREVSAKGEWGSAPPQNFSSRAELRWRIAT